MSRKFIYMDNAATTRPYDEVIQLVAKEMSEYGNPSAVYTLASKAKERLNSSRRIIAETLNCSMEEIIFTSGGTEADNWALRGIAENPNISAKGNHIITTKIEHHAILNTCKYLEHRGFRITYLDVDRDGIINLKQLKSAIKSDTILVSVMAANNEIGTIEPIREAAEIAHSKGAIFHTDAVQAYGHIPIDVKQDEIDLLSASAHKFGGPKGSGFLYVRKGLELESLIFGGGQERNHRAGTENVPGIAGMAEAARLSNAGMSDEAARLTELRDFFIKKAIHDIPYVALNGSADKRLPNNINLKIDYVEGESVLIMLDMAGISASAGSACSSGSLDPSHVLSAIGLPKQELQNSVRFSLGRDTTIDDVIRTIDTLRQIVEKLRSMSSAYKKMCALSSDDSDVKSTF